MPDIVIPLFRRRAGRASGPEHTPRHRLDGHFDEADNWHPSVALHAVEAVD